MWFSHLLYRYFVKNMRRFTISWHRRSQDFACGGALFSSNKLTTFFSHRLQKDGLKQLIEPPNILRTAKKCPKNWLLLYWGALTNFLCKLRLKILSALGCAPPGYAYVSPVINRLINDTAGFLAIFQSYAASVHIWHYHLCSFRPPT